MGALEDQQFWQGVRAGRISSPGQTGHTEAYQKALDRTNARLRRERAPTPVAATGRPEVYRAPTPGTTVTRQEPRVPVSVVPRPEGVRTLTPGPMAAQPGPRTLIPGATGSREEGNVRRIARNEESTWVPLENPATAARTGTFGGLPVNISTHISEEPPAPGTGPTTARWPQPSTDSRSKDSYVGGNNAGEGPVLAKTSNSPGVGG